jgi:AraC family ethanolamine operon transcriptional activator
VAGTSTVDVTERTSRTSTRRLEDADLEHVAASVQGWKTRLTQLAPGPGRGSIFETVLPDVRLVRLVVDSWVALEALPVASGQDELFHVGTICPAGESVLWQGFSVGPQMLLLEEGAVPSSFLLPPGCELLVARLDRTRVESLTRLLRGAAVESAACRTELRPQPGPALAELRTQLRAMAGGDRAAHGERIGPAEDDLYERVASMLAAPPVRLRPSPATRRRALRRAEEYMEAHAHERISLPDLCEAAECSERTLRQAFRECYGTNPMAFLKMLRLQGLRRALRDGRPDTATVQHLAARWGFWHMGHLGHDYKALFGETPGQTLAGTRYLDGARARRRARAGGVGWLPG